MIKMIFICWYLLFNIMLNNKCVDKYDILEKAYQNTSQEELIEFLDLWAKQYPPLLQDELEDKFKFEKEAYKIAEIFYNSKNLKLKDAKIDWSDTLYMNQKYRIVKSDIEVSFLNTEPTIDYLLHDDHSSNYSIIVIKNFRPDIDNAVELYYKYPFNYYLKDFLEGNFNIDGYITRTLNKTVLNRIEFLNKILRIYPSHWGGYWHIINEPFIEKIVFNNDYTKAYVYFRIEYKGGLTDFIKKQDKWEILESKIIWMQ